MPRLNTHSACLEGKSDILVPDQLFLKFILNFGAGRGEICNVTFATPGTEVKDVLRHFLR